MNYEEMLEARKTKKTVKTPIPYGFFYKRLIDGKYSNFVEFRDEIADQIKFSSSIKADCNAVLGIDHKGQLHFTPNEDNDGVYAVAVEVGNYQTLEQLINDNPAVVARNEFVFSTIHDLFDIVSEFHKKDIYYVCFAPSNILTRNSDNAVRLLFHGSFYSELDQELLYDGVEQFVAPEVFSGSPIDARTDVFSLGKLILWLYESSGLPFELKMVVEKAVSEDPDDRYATIEDLRSAINRVRSVRRTAVTAGLAVMIALMVVGLFFYLLPSPDAVEYVEPVEEPIPDEMLDEDMGALLGMGADADSAMIAHIVELQRHKNDSLGVGEAKLREYNAKAEAIFRKQFTKAADEILSEVYNDKQMNSTEKDFAAKSQAMTEKLAKKQAELMKSTTLSADLANGIASEIIEQLTEKKKGLMDKDYMGIKNQKTDDDVPSTLPTKK